MTHKLLLTTVLPKIIDKRMLAIRPTRITVGDTTEDCLVDRLSALEAQINTTVARHAKASQAGVPVDITGSVSSLDVFGPSHLPVAAEAAAASAETKHRVECLASMQAMFANIAIDAAVAPPTVSAARRLVLDTATRQDSSRAYNDALVTLLIKASKPGNTHYIGRAASMPTKNGPSDYMAACYVQAYYRGSPLLSIGEAAKVKNGAIIAWSTPPPRRRRG